MAKSLKSKSKRQFRKVKRDDPKSAFCVAEKGRLLRLSNKLQASAAKPKALTDAEEYRRKQDGYETEPEEEETAAATVPADKEMEVEGEAPAEGSAEGAKVSTSGPRLSRRENYKSSKGFQIRLTPKTHFRARGEGKRMGCKPQRRR